MMNPRAALALSIALVSPLAVYPFLLLAMTQPGCDKVQNVYVPPEPTIEVTITENNVSAEITVQYMNHSDLPQDRRDFVRLQSYEDVQAYRKEMEFALQRLQEAEERMQAHEQFKEPTSVPQEPAPAQP